MVEEGSQEKVERSSNFPNRQFWVIAALTILALFVCYWLLLRESYVPLLTSVEPQNAAEILKVLDAKKIPYEFEDEGGTIMVPSAEAAKARIELVGSELPMRGQVGFELFNQSDMGVTEFAQKINYQRALQGELARTILLLDGIQAVRVHLALPEHSLFREEETKPKASITLILKPGTTLTQSAVAGIQRMVAGAVPNLSTEAVAVLDGTGRVVSEDRASSAPVDSPNDALIKSYEQRALAAILAGHPALRTEVLVSLHFIDATAPLSPPSAMASGSTLSAPRGQPDYAINLRVTTPDTLDDAMRTDLTRAVEAAVGFDVTRGDTLVFLQGPLTREPSAAPTATSDRVVAQRDQPQSHDPSSLWVRYWPFIPIGAALLIIAAILTDRRRARLRRAQGLHSFAAQLRERLVASESSTT